MISTMANHMTGIIHGFHTKCDRCELSGSTLHTQSIEMAQTTRDLMSSGAIGTSERASDTTRMKRTMSDATQINLEKIELFRRHRPEVKQRRLRKKWPPMPLLHFNETGIKKKRHVPKSACRWHDDLWLVLLCY